MKKGLWVLGRAALERGDDSAHHHLAAASLFLNQMCDVSVMPFTRFVFDPATIPDITLKSEDQIRDEAPWCDPDDGLATFRLIQAHLQERPKEARAKLGPLIADLEDCIRKVERLKAEGDLFNLTLVLI